MAGELVSCAGAAVLAGLPACGEPRLSAVQAASTHSAELVRQTETQPVLLAVWSSLLGTLFKYCVVILSES